MLFVKIHPLKIFELVMTHVKKQPNVLIRAESDIWPKNPQRWTLYRRWAFIEGCFKTRAKYRRGCQLLWHASPWAVGKVQGMILAQNGSTATSAPLFHIPLFFLTPFKWEAVVAEVAFHKMDIPRLRSGPMAHPCVPLTVCICVILFSAVWTLSRKTICTTVTGAQA